MDGDPSPASPGNSVLCCLQGQGGQGGALGSGSASSGTGGTSDRVTLGGAALRLEPTGLLALTAEGYVLEVNLERELRVFLSTFEELETMLSEVRTEPAAAHGVPPS